MITSLWVVNQGMVSDGGGLYDVYLVGCMYGDHSVCRRGAR